MLLLLERLLHLRQMQFLLQLEGLLLEHDLMLCYCFLLLLSQGRLISFEACILRILFNLLQLFLKLNSHDLLILEMHSWVDGLGRLLFEVFLHIEKSILDVI